MTPARAPGERATGVVGGRFHDGGVATAAGHLGKSAIHRLRTPGYRGRSESRTRPRVTALREHGPNRSAAPAGGSHEPARSSPRGLHPSAELGGFHDGSGRKQARPRSSQSGDSTRVSTAAARLGKRPANRTRTINPATRSNNSCPPSTRSDPSTSAARRRVESGQSLAAKTTRHNTPGARSRPYIIASQSTQARVSSSVCHAPP
jgi:hypothetical protein